jgi:hypothetical protein
MIAKVRKKLAVSKRAAQKEDTERFNLRELNNGTLKKSIRLKPEKVCS